MFGNFSGRDGGLPNSKVFEEIFCLILDIYQERGGGYLIPKLLRNFSACIWTFFRRKGEGVYLIPKIMRNILVFTWTLFKLNLGGYPKSKHVEEL